MASNAQSQQIYEYYMNYASVVFSTYDDYDEFNIEILSNYMQQLYKNQIIAQQKMLVKGYYKLRPEGLYTFISDIGYSNLSDIFFNSLDSILESNSNTNKLLFIKECKEKNVECKEQETNMSKLNYNNIEHIQQFNINTHKSNKNITKKSNRCKYCFKFSPNVGSIKLTNPMRNRKLYNKNKHSLNLNKHPLDLITIHITNPLNGEKIKTSQIKVSVREDVKKRYTHMNDGKIHSLVLYHTEHDNVVKIIDIVSKIWNTISVISKDPRINKEEYIQYCYMLHWLLTIACPFFRGSAGFAKVILNAALFKLGFLPLRETKEYYTKSDWFAIFSPTFNIYYSKIPYIFEVDNDALIQMQNIKKSLESANRSHSEKETNGNRNRNG